MLTQFVCLWAQAQNSISVLAELGLSPCLMAQPHSVKLSQSKTTSHHFDPLSCAFGIFTEVQEPLKHAASVFGEGHDFYEQNHPVATDVICG